VHELESGTFAERCENLGQQLAELQVLLGFQGLPGCEEIIDQVTVDLPIRAWGGLIQEYSKLAKAKIGPMDDRDPETGYASYLVAMARLRWVAGKRKDAVADLNEAYDCVESAMSGTSDGAILKALEAKRKSISDCGNQALDLADEATSSGGGAPVPDAQV
jgi:hypothetical protein